MAGRSVPGITAQERRDQAALSKVESAANAAIAAANAKAENDKKLASLRKRLKDLEFNQTQFKAAIQNNVNALADAKQALIDYCKQFNPALKPYGSATPTAGQAKQMLAYSEEIKTIEAQKKTVSDKYQAASDQIAAIKKDISKLSHLQSGHGSSSQINNTFNNNNNNNSNGNGNGNNNPPPQPSTDLLVYEYNAPMTKSGYLNPVGIQSRTVTDPKVLANPEFTNAREYWKGVTPSKGTIQMSKTYAANAMKPKTTKGVVRSEQPYGFRFLYNPTDVAMAWGIVDAFSPEYVQNDSNGMSGVAVGLMKGTISFSLLLNRVDDMNYLNSNGLITSVDTTKIPADLDPAQRNNYYKQLYAATNPYPSTVPIEDQQTIYKRGTMYDLEYLFRAMGGYYADYKSGLNGVTADRGWLQPIPMELHLGAGLRYLIRVSSLDIKHIMFNERMVPTLTTVNVLCTRYYDTPDAFDTTFYAPESPAK